MKKLLVTLLIMAMSVSMLTACGGSDKNTDKDFSSGRDETVNQDAEDNQDAGLTEENNSEEQDSGFTGEEVSYTTKDKKVRVVYDEAVIRVVKAEDGYALKLGLVDKYYSESFDLLPYTPQSYYEEKKTAIESKAAAPEVGELNHTPEDKEGTGNVETSVFKMTRTYTDVSMGELEKITVASGMDVYRLEEKYTLTTTYEKISGSADDLPTEVFESDKYYYFIDLGDGYIISAYSFQVNAQSVDKEPTVDALEKILDAVYIEMVKE